MKRIFSPVPVLVLVFVFFLFAAPGMTLGADGKTVDASGDDKDVFEIEAVVVRGEVVEKDLAATSATVLNTREITQRVYITPLDIVTLSPGIVVHQYKQGGTAANFIMRGFSGNSHGANTAFFLDGIPLNEGDGYADTNIINPEEIRRVDIIKGPASALYGNYASAGTIAYYTKKKVDGHQLKLQYGSDNTYETNYVGGFSDEKWDQVYAIQNYHTDGYQDNSDWDRQNASARLTRHVTDGLNVRLSLQGFTSDWDAPGYIAQAQFDEDPTQAVSETNGGGKNRTAVRIDSDYQLDSRSKVLLYAWQYDQEFWRWYASDLSGLDAGTQVGNLRDFDRSVYGTGASYNFLGNLLSREFRLTAGSDYMVEDIYRQRWYLLSDTGREKGDKFWDYNIDMKTISLYVQGSCQMTDSFKMVLGARYDHFSGDLTDHLDDDTAFSMKDQGIFSPKAAAILTLMDGDLELFANYGKGFALLPGFSEQAAFKQNDWAPQERVQYETGARIHPTDRLKTEIIFFRLMTSKDFVYDSTTDEYDNVGETIRDGIEFQLELSLFDYGYIKTDYAYADARYEKYELSGVDYHGKTLRGVPENIYNAEAGYAPSSGWGGMVSYHYEDGYYLDDDNLYESDAWGRVDAQASYRFGSRAQYLACLDGVNLLNEKYADYTSGPTAKTYSPALPLSVYMTFKVEF